MSEATHRFVTEAEMQVEELPWGPHEWLARPGLTESEQLMLVRVRMPPGKAHKSHRHPEFEEIIYVVSGRAEQWVDRERRILTTGQTAHIPKDVVHSTANAGDETLVFLAILSPAEITGPPLVDVSDEEPWKNLAQNDNSSRPPGAKTVCLISLSTTSFDARRAAGSPTQYELPLD